MLPGALPYAAYDQMERDSMVQTALTIKKLSVLAAPWSVVPADDSVPAAERRAFVEEAFSRMEGSPSAVLLQAMDAFAKGWSIQEIEYREEGGRLWIGSVQPRDPARFGLRLDRAGHTVGLTLQTPGEPETELPPDKFVLYRNRPSYSRPKGMSDLDAAYRHWQSRTQLLSAWRVHLERFASPTLLGRYERGLPPDEHAGMLSALEQLKDRTAALFPNEVAVETIGGSKESSSGFLDALEFHNREIARAILGQTLTTDEGRRVGSLALGKVHLQVLLLQVDAIRRELADTVMTEQVVRPLVEANFGPGKVPRFEFESARLDAFASGRV